MKTVYLICIAVAVVAIAGAAVYVIFNSGPSPKGSDLDPEDPVIGDSDVLVAYFSWSGNTKPLAEWVADEADAEIYRIIPVELYPTDYDETADRAKNERDNNILPELRDPIDKSIMGEYDVILLGFPVWWYTLPMCVQSFLDEYDLSGKTVIPFFTHAGSSSGADSLGKLKELCPDSDVRSDKYFSVAGTSALNSEDDVREWVKDLGLSKE